MIRAIKGLESGERKKLLIRDNRRRGHECKFKKSRCLNNVKKFSFQNRTVNFWNGLQVKVVQTRHIFYFKTKLIEIVTETEKHELDPNPVHYNLVNTCTHTQKK